MKTPTWNRGVDSADVDRQRHMARRNNEKFRRIQARVNLAKVQQKNDDLLWRTLMCCVVLFVIAFALFLGWYADAYVFFDRSSSH